MEIPLKMMKNAFYFMLKTLFVIQIFVFPSRHFAYVEKRFDKKTKIKSKTCEVTDWTTNNYNTRIAQYLRKYKHTVNGIWSVIEYNTRNILLEKLYTKCGEVSSRKPLYKK